MSPVAFAAVVEAARIAGQSELLAQRAEKRASR
jgi:hypothetical protein